ncbi:MAG: TldD/PmbA family protein [Myxococcota bacterium]
MMALEEAQRTLEVAVETARQGADEAEAALLGGTLGVTRFADNEVHQAVEQSRDLLSIRVITKGRAARAETSDVSLTGLRAAARQARLSAEAQKPQESKVYLPGPQTYRSHDAFDPDTERATPLDRMAPAGRAIIEAHRHGLFASGYVATRWGAPDFLGEGDRPYAIMNTKGLFAYAGPTRASFCVTMRNAAGPTGWADAEAHALAALDADAALERAKQKALITGAPRTLKPGLYDVILEPAAVASLLEFVGEECGAENLEAGRSFLAGRIGQKLAGENVTIIDDVLHPLHRGVPFDPDGIPRRRVPIIEGGVAKGTVSCFETAMRLGIEPTGHRRSSALFGEGEVASHLVMTGGTKSYDELLGETKAAVLVTRIWYARLVDPRSLMVTGVTRDGTFLVEGGRVVGPVADMRFNVSVLDLLSRIEAMTASVWSSGLVVPCLRASGFPFTAPVPR